LGEGSAHHKAAQGKGTNNQKRRKEKNPKRNVDEEGGLFERLSGEEHKRRTNLNWWGEKKTGKGGRDEGLKKKEKDSLSIANEVVGVFQKKGGPTKDQPL